VSTKDLWNWKEVSAPPIFISPISNQAKAEARLK